MIQNQRQDNRHNIRLPNQVTIPDLKQIYGLQTQAQSNAGRTVELPFGEAPDDYILTIFRDKTKGDWLWMLYRGQGNDAFLEWSYVTPDPGVIHNVINAQFPGAALNMSPGNGTSPHDHDAQALINERLKASQTTTSNYESQSQSSNYERQSSTSGMSKLQRATLEGELENLSVPNVLQSIAMGKMTGRLEIASNTDVANVYFFDGSPLHCVMRGVEGDAAIIELVGWSSGAFRFYPEPRTPVETVKKRLDWLLMEGAAFDDQHKFLNARGLTLESFVVRKHNNITESLFEQKIAKGACNDMRLLKGFYQSIDSKSTLVEVLRRRPLPKIDWVLVLYTLVSCDLVQFVGNLPEPAKPVAPGVPDVDWQGVREFEKTMLRADTQLYTYPAFLYFLEKEFLRFERFSQPFSIIIIEAGLRNPTNIQVIDPLPLNGVKEVAKRVNRLKRKTDLLGHYETNGLALLLPLTDGTSARSFASRLADVIVSTPLSADIDVNSLVLSIGTASIPESCQDLGAMLAMARPSKA
jgi:GGDEF domain-containing protein